MSGWETRALGEVCTLVNGGTPKTSVERYWNGSHLWITPAEMGKRASPYANDTERKLTDDGLNSCSAQPLPPLSVILSSRAPIGHLVINTAPMATNQGCKGLIPGRHLDHKFLFYFLGSIVDHLNDLGTGATFKELSGGKLKEVRVPLPPLAEQRRIVAILDEAFAGLAKMRANAEANLKNARAIFDSYLNSVFSEARGGWRNVTLEEVSGIESNLVDPREAAYIDLPHIGAGNMVSMTGEIVDVKTAREEKLISGKFLFDRETVLYSKIRPYLMKACLPTFDGLCSADVYPLKPKPGRLDRSFLYHLLMSSRFTEYAIAGSARAGMPKVNRDHLFAYAFALPPIADQGSLAQRFDALLAASRELEAINRSRLRAIEELKQSILDKAFAGKMTPTVVPLVAAPAIISANDNRPPTAAIMARAFARHQRKQRDWSFGHVKAQKTLHMVEAVAGYELGRAPRKDAAGPNDMPHMTAAEHWAEDNRHFKFPKVGEVYRLEPLEAFDALLRQTDAIDTTQLKAIDRVIDIFILMDAREAELFATVHAAWNNLLIDGETPTDDAIIREAREDWHPKKLDISRADFAKALAAVRRSGMIPTGKGKRVGEPPHPRLL